MSKKHIDVAGQKKWIRKVDDLITKFDQTLKDNEEQQVRIKQQQE